MKKRDKYLIATIISITLFTAIVLFLNAYDHEVSPGTYCDVWYILVCRNLAVSTN